MTAPAVIKQAAINRLHFDVDRAKLPTMYELPSEDPEESGLPDDFHYWQPQLLRETFQPDPERVDRCYIGTDINLYYDVEHVTWYKRPDWFVVLGAEKVASGDELRWSYVIWQEELAPFLVVELLSPGTEDEDLGNALRGDDRPPGKWAVYEQYLQVPYYVVYSRYTRTMEVFRRDEGRYRRQPHDDRRGGVVGVWLEAAGLGLGVWSGLFEGIKGDWLRFYDVDGRWHPSKQEQLEAEQGRAKGESRRAERATKKMAWERQRAEQERQRAEQERQRAEQERQRAERERNRADEERQRAEQLAQRLRALGIDPDA